MWNYLNHLRFEVAERCLKRFRTFNFSKMHTSMTDWIHHSAITNNPHSLQNPCKNVQTRVVDVSPADRSLVGVASLVGSRSRSSKDTRGLLSKWTWWLPSSLSREEGISSRLLLRLDMGETSALDALVVLVSLLEGELRSGMRVLISSHSVHSRPSTWPFPEHTSHFCRAYDYLNILRNCIFYFNLTCGMKVYWEHCTLYAEHC